MKLHFYELILVLCICVSPLFSQELIEKDYKDPYGFTTLNGGGYTRLASGQALMNRAHELDISVLKDWTTNLTVHNFFSESFADIVSEKCGLDLQYMFQEIPKSPMGWAGKMVDSFGKPESGIFEGNFMWVGNYDECLKVYAPKYQNNTQMGDFNGKYCKLDVLVTATKELMLPLTIGTCFPDSCNSTELSALFTSNERLIFATPAVTCLPTTRKFPAAAVGVLFLISIFVLLAALGSALTAYEYFTSPDTPEIAGNDKNFALTGDKAQESAEELSASRKGRVLPIWMQQAKPFLNCFCVFTNGEKLLNTAETEGQMLCLHGIRFLSLSWVVLCHVYSAYFGSVKNRKEAILLADNVLFQIVLNGFYSVDSFFLLSGFLLAYLFFVQCDKTNGKIPWVYFYVHRYIRLTPVYAIVLGFFTCVKQHLGSGPFWPVDNIDPVCSRNWWYNLLYINNLQNAEESCMSWSWYLSNDMQLFVISPIFLFTLWRWPKIGYAVVALFGAITFAANFGITYHYNLIGGLGNIQEAMKGFQAFMVRWGEYYDKIYVKPYTRMGPYLVGIALAYYLHQRRKRNPGKDRMAILCIGWFIATTVTLTCEFALFNRDISKVEASFYNAFNRSCFAGGLAWVIYVCLTGQGGPVNGILSFKLWIPLSRITYCAYLVHPIVLGAYFGTRRDQLHFSHFEIVMAYIGILALSYMGAFVTSLLFESPVIRLDKYVMNMFRRR